MAILQVSFLSETLHRTVPLAVILPTDKMGLPGMPRRDPSKPFKTLYLLHGMLGSCNDWLYGTRIQRWAEERDLAVVMPSGENSMYLDLSVDRYGAFIGEELVDFTRRSFPLSHDRADTYIGGLSMGGFGAMRNVLKYRDTFSAILSLSGSFILNQSILTPVAHPIFIMETEAFRRQVFGADYQGAIHSDRNPETLVKALSAAGAAFPEIYMACGKHDFLLQENLNFHQLLLDAGVRHTFELGDGAHDWDFWDTYLQKALDFLPLEGVHAGCSSGNIPRD